MQKVRLICEDCKQEFEYDFTFDTLAECPHCGSQWEVDWLATWGTKKQPWIVGPWRDEPKPILEEKIDWVEEEKKRQALAEEYFKGRKS
jgi:hypothetical protein